MSQDPIRQREHEVEAKIRTQFEEFIAYHGVTEVSYSCAVTRFGDGGGFIYASAITTRIENEDKWWGPTVIIFRDEYGERELDPDPDDDDPRRIKKNPWSHRDHMTLTIDTLRTLSAKVEDLVSPKGEQAH